MDPWAELAQAIEDLKAECARLGMEVGQLRGEVEILRMVHSIETIATIQEQDALAEQIAAVENQVQEQDQAIAERDQTIEIATEMIVEQAEAIAELEEQENDGDEEISVRRQDEEEESESGVVAGESRPADPIPLEIVKTTDAKRPRDTGPAYGWTRGRGRTSSRT